VSSKIVYACVYRRTEGILNHWRTHLHLNKALLHEWNVSATEARALQRQLQRYVVTENCLGPVSTVAGVDVSFPGRLTARAAIVVLTFPDLRPVDHAIAETEVAFPYIPGLLAFREVPAVLAAVTKLQTVPDLFLFDAHGLAHPRRLGLASHAGVLLDWPSIGCAKSRLVGEYIEPARERGSMSVLSESGQPIGMVVRTRTGVKPVFVSVGHRVDLAVAVRYVLDCALKYRLPETTRWAHRVAGGAKLNYDSRVRQ
jgi:deoxyribonuclease V